MDDQKLYEFNFLQLFVKLLLDFYFLYAVQAAFPESVPTAVLSSGGPAEQGCPILCSQVHTSPSLLLLTLSLSSSLLQVSHINGGVCGRRRLS